MLFTPDVIVAIGTVVGIVFTGVGTVIGAMRGHSDKQAATAGAAMADDFADIKKQLAALSVVAEKIERNQGFIMDGLSHIRSRM